MTASSFPLARRLKFVTVICPLPCPSRLSRASVHLTPFRRAPPVFTALIRLPHRFPFCMKRPSSRLVSSRTRLIFVPKFHPPSLSLPKWYQKPVACPPACISVSSGPDVIKDILLCSHHKTSRRTPCKTKEGMDECGV